MSQSWERTQSASSSAPSPGSNGDTTTVPVPRGLLREVISDGCCPLHLRLQLVRALGGEEEALTKPAIKHHCVIEVGPLADLDRRCLATVAAYLPLAEVLTVRACSRDPLQWAMQRGAEEHGPRHWVHNRIRARLWMRRIADLTAGTKDESVFETQMRSLADAALRSRMETEMQDALSHMETQIHNFQAEVDRRLEEQERHVKQMVEKRVEQELDTILASEVAKVQAMVEERVRERVSNIFRREVKETVRELQMKLDALAQENKLLREENEDLRDAFAEANLRTKCFFWALYPPVLQTMSAATCGFGKHAVSLQHRLSFARALCNGAPAECLEPAASSSTGSR